MAIAFISFSFSLPALYVSLKALECCVYAFAHKVNFRQFCTHTFPSFFRICTHFAVVENQPSSNFFFHFCSFFFLFSPIWYIFNSFFSLALSFDRTKYKCLLANLSVCKCVQHAHKFTSMCVCDCVFTTYFVQIIFFLAFRTTMAQNECDPNRQKFYGCLRLCFNEITEEWENEQERETECIWLMIAPICNKINYTLNVTIPSRRTKPTKCIPVYSYLLCTRNEWARVMSNNWINSKWSCLLPLQTDKTTFFLHRIATHFWNSSWMIKTVYCFTSLLATNMVPVEQHSNSSSNVDINERGTF